MAKPASSLHWLSLAAVCVFAALYATAMITAPPSTGLQITSMLNFEKGSEISRFTGWFYTIALVLTALAGVVATFRRTRFLWGVVVFLAGFSFSLTLMPMIFSFLYNFKASFYENYVGESLTGLSLLILAVTSGMLAGDSQKPEYLQD